LHKKPNQPQQLIISTSGYATQLTPAGYNVPVPTDVPPPPDAPASPSLLQRLVMLKPGEGLAFIWSALYFFCLLFGYYLLRPIREEFAIRGELSDLPWLWTGTTAAMLIATPLFAWLVSRMPRRRFIPLVYRLFAIILMLFYAILLMLEHEQEKPVGYAFYIFLSVFNLFIVSIFWGFMADIYRPEQAKRLFAAIGVGGTLGATLGGVFVELWISKLAFPPIHLFLISVLMLELAVQCVRQLARLFQLGTPNEPRREGQTSREPTPSVWSGFVLLARSRYLQMLVAYMLCYTVVGAFLYFEQARIVRAAYEDFTARTLFFNRLDLATNILTLLTPLFITSRLISRLGTWAGLSLLPIITILGFAAIMGADSFGWTALAVFAVFRVLQRSMHYAVDRPTREMLYAPLGADEKYKSKSFIDTFVYRGGDLLGAWAQSIKAVAAHAAPIAIGIGALWLAIALILAAMNRAILRKHPNNHGPSSARS